MKSLVVIFVWIMVCVISTLSPASPFSTGAITNGLLFGILIIVIDIYLER